MQARLTEAGEDKGKEDLRSAVAYSLFNVIAAYVVYDSDIDIHGIQPRLGDPMRTAAYSPELGMCQVIAALLYHTKDEVSSFWIAVSLVDNYDMRQFY